MEKNEKFSAVAVNNTITLMKGNDQINLQRGQNPELFQKIFDLLKNGKSQEVSDRFFEFKAAISKYTEGNFYFEGDTLRLKDDDEAIPVLLAKKLVEFKDNDEQFMPLIRFWKKLKLNPDPNVREQLYAFLSHNHIPLTENGDVICEKGVAETKGGKLVDQRTKTIDNSIGMVVVIARDKVDKDPNRTCSTGLHVGAPEFVRKHWTSGLIVEVLVDPADFVAIPKDYSETKARVCRYQVIGLAPSSPTKKLVYKFEDIIAPTFGAQETQKKRERFDPREANDHSAKPSDVVDFSKMTAKAIVAYVQKTKGVSILKSPGDLKNKKSIIKRAERALQGKQEKQRSVKMSDIRSCGTIWELIQWVKLYIGVELKNSKKGRADMERRAVQELQKNGVKVIGS